MSLQPAPSQTQSTRRADPRQRRKPGSYKLPAAEHDLAPLTEDDDVFIALATIDLLQRLEHEPL